jgi:hypothetical protein
VSGAPRIGIYVHHHGGGHAARASAIGAALAARGAAVAYLSSLSAERMGPGETVWLPLDIDLGPEPGETPAELHFAPLGSAGLATRMAGIARWCVEWRPDLLLVDVSVEVAMLARLCGVPFAYLRQTGERDDPPHELAYRWAAGLLAPYTERQGTESEESTAVGGKTFFAGGITRFDGAPRPDAGERPRRALVLARGEGLVEEIAAAAPEWEVLGPRPVDLDLLTSCAVVVAPGGANAVAEAAFARCGLVCIPEERPFGEQFARARALERDEAAAVIDEAADAAPPAGDLADGSAPSASAEVARPWSAILDEALRRRDALAHWADGGGAGRAADYLVALAERGASVPASSSQSTSPAAASSASQPFAGQSPQRSR